MMTPDEILRQADEQIAVRKSSNKPATASGDQSNGGWSDPWSDAPSNRGFAPGVRTDGQAQQQSSDGFGARLKQGIGRAVDSAQVALSGDEGVIAKVAADQQRNALPQTALQRQMAEEIAPYNEAAKNAEGFVDSARAWGALGLKRAGQLISNPAEAGKMIVEQLPNSIPGLAGGFAGAKAGAAVGTAVAPGPGTVVGAALGGLAGGFAGGYGLEKGASVLEQVQEKAHQQGVDLQDQNAARGFVAKNLAEIDEAATRKAVGTAGTDAALNVLTMGAAGLSGRGIVNEARALAKAVDDGVVSAADATAALARLEAANAARNTLGQKALRGAAVVGAEMAGEGVSEAVGQKYAYGEVDPGQVIDEALLGLGQGGAMALGGKAFRKAAGLPDNDDAATRSLDDVHSALAKNAGVQPDAVLDDGDMVREAQNQNLLALPAPVIDVGSNGVARTADDRNARLQRIATGDITDVTPIERATPVEVKPSEAMGLRTGPDAGPLENAAALSVDTGATAQMQQEAVLAEAAEAAQKAKPETQKQERQAKAQQQEIDQETGEILSEPALADWSDADLSTAFRNAQSNDMRLQLANELSRRAAREEDALQAELRDEQAAESMPDVPDNAFARTQEDAGPVPKNIEIQDDQAQTVAPGANAEGANVATLAQLNRKKLAEMSDDELQQLSSMLPADHSRQQKIQKAIQTRATQAQAAINEGVKADGTQTDQAQQAGPQPAQAGAAQAGGQGGVQVRGATDSASAAGDQTTTISPNAAPNAGVELAAMGDAGKAAEQSVQGVPDVTKAGQQWKGMTTAQRQEAVARAQGIAPVIAKNMPRAEWGKLNADIQRKMADAMEPKAAQPVGDETPFAADSGTLGIPRSEMPQVPTANHGGLVKHLNALGIAHETKTVDAADLKPTQAEYSPSKVESAKTAGGDRAVIVSSDGHIIDGHHQAVAAAEEDKPVKAIVLDASVEQALEAVKASPSANLMQAAAGTTMNTASNDAKGDTTRLEPGSAPSGATDAGSGKPMAVGVTPGNAEPVTVRDGVVYVGKYEALDYDTGEPVTVPKGSTRADVAQALKDAGAMGRNQKVFGLGGQAGDVMFGDQPAPSQAKALQQVLQKVQADQAPSEFIPAPDGGLDYGEITPEMGQAMRRQAGKIRLQQGVQNTDGTGWGLAHIEANHGEQIRGLGFGGIADFVARVAGGIQQVWQVPGNSQLLVTTRDGRKDVMYVQLEIAKEGDFYRINSAFPVRQQDYESRKGMKKIWDGSEPTPAVTGQRPAYATAASASPENVSSQGSSNARGQIAGSVPPAPAVAKAAKPAAIEDFGEKLEGARKDLPLSLKEEVSDAQMASLPLSKIWPSDAHEEIQNDAAAALVFAARQEIPAKPRQSVKVQRWVQKVKSFRALVTSDEALAGQLDKLGLDGLSQRVVAGSALEGFFAKVRLLAQLPRDTWGRVDKVGEYPNAVRYGEDGKQVSTPFSVVVIDGEPHEFKGAQGIGPDELAKVKELLGAAAPKKGALTAADFEIRTYKSRAESFVSRKGDKELRPLKTFTGEGSGSQARQWLNAHVAQAEAEWEAVKVRDNVGKGDMRNAQNRQRVGADHRKGADVTAQMFEESFGFRGVQFGNWVAQGAGAKDRQGLLNESYDALMDLAEVLGLPSQAMSLNGSLGLSLGARGSGKAAAHFEPDSLVINLTKTKGAGSLAHEWFHALDNYFSRMRGGEEAFTGDNNAYRQNNFVTYKPEAAWGKTPISKYTHFMRGGQLRERLQRLPGFTYDANKTLAENAKAAGFERDPNHKEGVRPQVEKAFADLVQALNDSPMAKRASAMDKAADGYWGRIIERGARSFENYVINKMALQGYSNDFLANIRNFDEWQALGKNAERYPYLTPAEEGPVVEAFDNLFETIETRQGDDGNVELYFAANPARRPGTAQDKAVMQAIADGKSARDVLRLIASGSKDPFLRQVARLLLKSGITPNIQFGYIGKTEKGDPIHGQYRGKSDTIAIAGSAEYAAERIFMHEAMHAATMRALKKPGLVKLQLQKLLEHVREQPGAAGFYGLKNVDEFVVEVFTNPDFQAALRGMSAPTGSPLKSAWHSFVQVLRRILGLGDNSTSVLSQALELGVAAVRQDMVLRRQGARASGRANAGTDAIDQTQTEAFKRWFGDSKVVDAEGKPLVVYHGTEADFSEFSREYIGSANTQTPMGSGFFFAKDPAVAGRYAERASANVMPVYVSVQNPAPTLEAMTATGSEYDGFINSKIVVARSSLQIKSAIGNNGNFDPEDANILNFGADDVQRNISNGIKAVTAMDVKQLGRHKLTDWLKLGLQFLGRRQLVDVYGDLIPQMRDYDRLAAQMEADKNESGAEADELVRRWAKLPDEGKLADLMHDATLAQIDADSDVAAAADDDRAQATTLKARFKALSPEAQAVYRESRDGYKAHHEKVRKAIRERIERSELSSEKRHELLTRMDDDFFQKVKGVYFPLARFGRYVAVVKDGAGQVVSVSRAETMPEAESARAALLKAFPTAQGFTVGRVTLDKEFVASHKMVGRGFMTDLYRALEGVDLPAQQLAELEDTLGQLYLSSLPDLSWAKHGIHRKGTPGFSQDARRAFAQNMFHGARYLAKLRYSDVMQDNLDAMQKHVDEWAEVTEDFDQPKAQRVVDEMAKRHDSMMNPKSNPLSTALTSFGFLYYLGLSPAAAVVNLSQTALVAYPVMAGKWGYQKAGAALLRASKESVAGKNNIRTQLTDKDEIAAYEQAVNSGVIDVTMAHDLAGIAQGEDQKVSWALRPVMRMASYMFHQAELFNRQSTFMAAFRLARDAGATPKDAYEQAVKATYDGHFDYGAANRPRVM